MIATYKGL